MESANDRRELFLHRQQRGHLEVFSTTRVFCIPAISSSQERRFRSTRLASSYLAHTKHHFRRPAPKTLCLVIDVAVIAFSRPVGFQKPHVRERPGAHFRGKRTLWGRTPPA